MPIDYKKYPKNWKKIRTGILKRAGDKCEFCGVPNYATGYRDQSGNFISTETILNALNKGYDYFNYELSHIPDDKKPLKIVLTIAHLDHDITNSDPKNLKALCQRCHLRHDVKHHKASRRRNKLNTTCQISTVLTR